MKNNNRCGRLLFFAGLLTLSIITPVNAALVSRLGGQAVYDTDLDITWLADANLAASNNFGVSGIGAASGPSAGGYMTYSTAQSWIAAMNASNSGTGYLGFNDWRLPSTLQPDPSCEIYYNCTGSEMGHLFYNELGGIAGQSLVSTHNVNYSLFQNIQPENYWSGTEYVPGSVWYFNLNWGHQLTADYFNYMWAFPVRAGDVAVVPVPATLWLMCSGLVGLASVVRKHKAA